MKNRQAELHVVVDDVSRNACLFDSRRFNGLTFPGRALYKRKRPTLRDTYTLAHRRPPAHFVVVHFIISPRPMYEHVVSSVLKQFDRSVTVISGVKRAFVLPLASKQLTHVQLVRHVDDWINV